MIKLINFLKNEDGAVTVDWVVLTGSVIGMGLVVVSLIAGGATDASGSVGAGLEAAQPVALDFNTVGGSTTTDDS